MRSDSVNQPTPASTRTSHNAACTTLRVVTTLIAEKIMKAARRVKGVSEVARREQRDGYRSLERPPVRRVCGRGLHAARRTVERPRLRVREVVGPVLVDRVQRVVDQPDEGRDLLGGRPFARCDLDGRDLDRPPGADTDVALDDRLLGKAGDLRYYIPSKDELETWVYRAGAVERVRTGLGHDEAVRV